MIRTLAAAVILLTLGCAPAVVAADLNLPNCAEPPPLRLCLPIMLGMGILGSVMGAGETRDGGNAMSCTTTLCLDGEWQLATDPANAGREEEWWSTPRPEAKATRAPWIIQDAFPGYHGVAWYWRDFDCPANPHVGGRHLLRFWAVNYLAEVWVNGRPVGGHEGGETPFVLDVTDAVKPGEVNRLAVRVLNPTNEPIDGYVIRECPGRNRVIPYSAGSDWAHGGIVDSVELLVTPAARIADLLLKPDWKTGIVRAQVALHNAGAAVPCRLQLAVSPAASGETLATAMLEHQAPSGESAVAAELRVADVRLWDLNDPFLYRVTARVQVEDATSLDEASARCGFRDFRFEDGCFRLNGRRIFLRCSHTGNCCPVGQMLPVDPDWLRRDLLNVKVMGFNAIRFIAGMAARRQLDFCDEIGLMVYEEPYAAWCLADSPHMKERYDTGLREMILRDRNHPSITMWGLLNETPDGPVFRNAVAALPWLRELDDTRLVFLNSGRWDADLASRLASLEIWRRPDGPDPNVTHNPTQRALTGTGMTWQPGAMAFHPGPNGEYSVARWTAPEAGEVQVAAEFRNIAERATTDVHVLHNGATLFRGFINVEGGGNEAEWTGKVTVNAGDMVDCVVGWGNGGYGGDSTGMAVRLKCGDAEYDAAQDFSVASQPNGPWRYGWLAPGAEPAASTFTRYPLGETMGEEAGMGSLSNPGSGEWEDTLSDQHHYPRVPHTAETINLLRTASGGANPVFISEYGIGSAVDLIRAARNYERLGKTGAEDAQFYRDKLDKFLADWERWRMDECFARPEDFFAQSNARMASQRLLGLNAIRANMNCVAHSVTGTVDQGMSGEGLFTTFRELKPGTVDAVFEGFAPLRLCLFAEPVNVYQGQRVRLEAVLANEDALPPGEHPVRIEVLGPGMTRPLRQIVTARIPEPTPGDEPPFAQPVFSEDLVCDGPEGTYRFLATLESGGAATGGEAEFYVTDASKMPPVTAEVVLWGRDEGLQRWLQQHGVRTRPFQSEAEGRAVILVGREALPGGPATWRELAGRMARGDVVVFLCPEVFREGDDSTRWLPLAEKGAVADLRVWLYHKDDWAKAHPIFAGLPAGGLLDYDVYRELIPDAAFVGQPAPQEAVAGANDCSLDYASGLLVAEYPFGAGRFVVNTLLIRENLGSSPVAERLLRNMLNYAAGKAEGPVAELPEGFQAMVKAAGYGE